MRCAHERWGSDVSFIHVGFQTTAQAALPILRLGIDWYANWTTVVIVPNHFTNERVARDEAGVVHEWLETEAGESWRKLIPR